MKRFFSFFILFVLCACVLGACTPSVSDVESSFKESGYIVNKLEKYYAVAYGADDSDVEYVLIAMGDGNSSTVYVFGFKDNQSAKKFYDKNKQKEGANFKVKRRGRVVALGSEQGVEIL